MTPSPSASRRAVLAATAGAAAATVATPAAAQEESLDEFLGDVGDGVVDRTGEDEVTVAVGAGENGLRFDPVAVRIDAGTTVVWEWTGEGGAHNVESVEGSDFEFRSGDTVDSDTETFERTFEEAGTARYVCDPHATAGMRGAVIVAPPDPTPVVEDHVADVEEYDGVVDRRGEDEVAVTVGAGENGLRFDPIAVRVDPGTNVVWEWTGEGGAHNVASVDDAGADVQFGSGDPVDSDSETFERTFSERGAHPYVCDPHATAGMRGAVVVGDAGASDAGGTGGGEDLRTLGGAMLLLLAPVAGALALLNRELSEVSERRRRRSGGV